MKNKSGISKSAKYKPFSQLLEEDRELAQMRREYESDPPDERQKAALFEYDFSLTSETFNSLLVFGGIKSKSAKPCLPPGFAALVIDPLCAPALLTVGSTDYFGGCKAEGMKHLLTLIQLPDDQELVEIIEKAGNFLLDCNDLENALTLYLAAEKAFPHRAIYYIGSAYCYGKLGKHPESVLKHRKAVELEPENYYHLNDLGFSLLEAGEYAEAESVLNKSIELSPPDYNYPRNNLEELKKRRALVSSNNNGGKKEEMARVKKGRIKN